MKNVYRTKDGGHAVMLAKTEENELWMKVTSLADFRGDVRDLIATVGAEGNVFTYTAITEQDVYDTASLCEGDGRQPTEPVAFMPLVNIKGVWSDVIASDARDVLECFMVKHDMRLDARYDRICAYGLCMEGF